MSRIRSIKPEFPQSETIGNLSRDARLLFIQLWTIADDDGRTRAASRMLASLLYPYDDDAPGLIDGWLSELEKNDCVRLYRHEGTTYLEIINWLKHQKIDHPSKSKIPPFREEIRESSRILAPDLGSRTKDLGSRIKKESSSISNSKSSAAKAAFERFYRVYPKHVDRQAALAKFERITKSGVSVETIITAASRYAEACRDAFKEKQFIKSPAIWLNKGCYDDEDLPHRQRDGPIGKSNGIGNFLQHVNGSIEKDHEYERVGNRGSQKSISEVIPLLPAKR